MNILIALAGIVFGGGMIGQLIMFFVKRNDEIKMVKNEYLRTILEKVSDYGKFVTDQMVHSIHFIESSIHLGKQEVSNFQELVELEKHELKQLGRIRKDCLKKNIKNCAKCEALTESTNTRFKKISEKKGFLNSDSFLNQSQINEELDSTFENIKSFNGMLNILPQAYISKHKHIVKMLGDLDLVTLKLIFAKNANTLEEYIQINKMIVSQLTLLEKLKHAICKEIK
jgi:hypothetical protein